MSSPKDAPPPPYSAIPPPIMTHQGHSSFSPLGPQQQQQQYLPGYGGPPPSSVVLVSSSQHQFVPPTTATTTIIHVTNASFGPDPIRVTCGNCSQVVVTNTGSSPGLLTWILSGSLLALGCWLGCCLIPCCIRECQDVDHFCPNCQKLLGTFRRC